ncbi:MAG: hypothetical protein QUS35_02090 [bacterium]|nr:hypothetical protein [bacterium]
MQRNTIGVISLGAVALALAAAVQSLFQESILLGTAYLLLASLAVPVVLFAFCAKCPDRDNCGHALPGKAAAALFSKRKCSPYTAGDRALTAAGLAVLLLLPQIWLWKHPVAFVFFWIVMIAAVTGIRAKLCPSCRNTGCPACGGKSRGTGSGKGR